VAIKRDVKVEIQSPDVSGKVMFDTLRTTRLVKPYISAYVVLLINQWLNQNNYSSSGYQLLPENIVEFDDLPKYSEFYVKSSRALLQPNTLLSFNEALFLFLGLNPSVLIFPPFNQLNLFEYIPPLDYPSSLECVFFTIKHYQILKKSAFLKNDGRITSENLLKVIQQEKSTLQKESDLDSSYSVNHKKSTVQIQKLITTIAIAIIKNYPEIQKQTLASDINKKLKEEHNITHLKDSTIERQYLKDYKLLKGIA